MALKNVPLTVKIEKNGDDYTLLIVDSNSTRTINFKNGVEFEETVAEKFVVSWFF